MQKFNCGTCGKEVYRPTWRIKKCLTGIFYCSQKCCCDANNKKKADQVSGMRKGEVLNHCSTSSRFATIRKNARRTYLASDKPKCCLVCGYSKHIEICHVQGITTFPDETKLIVINDLTNLVALCPTHHWELDNKQLDEEILPERFALSTPGLETRCSIC